MMKHFAIFSLFLIIISISAVGQEPVRIGIAGLSHSHVIPLLRDLEREDIEIVGISESNKALAERYADAYNINRNLIYTSLDQMLENTHPEGVITFTSIFEHLDVVKSCAPRGIHVMVEKPLAVSNEHARTMKKLSEEHGTLVLTNYETSWYPSNYKGYKMVDRGDVGDLRKVIVYDGHKGPKEINVNPEFLEWLTDPVLNGGGAVIDFGCYGADLITWLLKGEKPLTVFADLKQYKPEVYPWVDDDATIILSYPGMEGVIHASWNWPFNRKDMHIYGSTGYIFIDDAETIRFRLDEKSGEEVLKVPESMAPFVDPFAFFAAAVKGTVQVHPGDLSSLEINLTVVEILEAARLSSETGEQVQLEQ